MLAEELAKNQRSISVAEFFEKNKHLLGFDSLTRGIITTVKEAVDNALDACEEAEVLPDIHIGIRKPSPDVIRIIVEDNGPGIVPGQIPFVFGKLLYGSRFHQIKQSRGQQGIGISAAVLYAQLTTGKPAVITSRTGPNVTAHQFEIQINIESNEPDIISHQEVSWDRTHGTRVEIEFRGSLAARKRLLEYLKFTSIVNPHARIRLESEDGVYTFERVSDEPIPYPKPIPPHPMGIEIGQLKRMAAASGNSCEEFLMEDFCRVGKKTAAEICRRANLSGRKKAGSLDTDETKRLLEAMQSVKVPAPPTTRCLSPIGEELLKQSLDKEYEMDFIRARTRPSNVFGGHPFIVEAALGYGGKLHPEGNAQILRFANRVPLVYQQGACVITGSITSVNWKSYGVSQSTVPTGPLLILVHVASTNVPFTSESKDAIAAIPEIERDIVLALQDLGRELKTFLARREKNRARDERARAVCAIIPDIAAKVSDIVELPVPDVSAIEGRIMRKLVAKKHTENGRVIVEVNNYTGDPKDIAIYDISPDDAGDAVPPPSHVTRLDELFTKLWQVHIDPGTVWKLSYSGLGGGTLEIRGPGQEQYVVVDLDA